MTPMEYGERVQDALRKLIEKRFRHEDSPVQSRAELSRALGHGENRQYVASRFKPDPKSGKLRDFTVPDLLAMARALGLDGTALLQAARDEVDAAGEAPGEAEAARAADEAGAEDRITKINTRRRRPVAGMSADSEDAEEGRHQ